MEKGSLSGLDLLQGPLEATLVSESMLLPQAVMKPKVRVKVCSLCHCLMPW